MVVIRSEVSLKNLRFASVIKETSDNNYFNFQLFRNVSDICGLTVKLCSSCCSNRLSNVNRICQNIQTLSLSLSLSLCLSLSHSLHCLYRCLRSIYQLPWQFVWLSIDCISGCLNFYPAFTACSWLIRLL